MPLRKPTVRPNFSFATASRRRRLKTLKGREKEASRILSIVLRRVGGSFQNLPNDKFSLNLSNLGLTELPDELFEDEFLYEKCVNQLVELDISKNCLRSLDKELGDFISLNQLFVASNR